MLNEWQHQFNDSLAGSHVYFPFCYNVGNGNIRGQIGTLLVVVTLQFSHIINGESRIILPHRTFIMKEPLPNVKWLHTRNKLFHWIILAMAVYIVCFYHSAYSVIKNKFYDVVFYDSQYIFQCILIFPKRERKTSRGR